MKPGETKNSHSECGGVQREAGGKAQNEESESQGRASGEEGAIGPVKFHHRLSEDKKGSTRCEILAYDPTSSPRRAEDSRLALAGEEKTRGEEAGTARANTSFKMPSSE